MLRHTMLGLALLPALAAPVWADETDVTRETVMGVLRGFGALDADAMAAGFAEDATVITPQAAYHGKAEIRDYFAKSIGEWSNQGIATETHALVFEGPAALVVWSGHTPEHTYDYAADSYFVQDGKIVSAVYAAKVMMK